MYISASSFNAVETQSCNYRAEVSIFRVHFLLAVFVANQATIVFGFNICHEIKFKKGGKSEVKAQVRVV